VRFLHLQGRLVGQLDCPCAELPESEEPAYRVVERLKVGDRLLQSWQEAVQQEVVLAGLNLGSLEGEPQHSRVTFPACRNLEPVRGPGLQIEAILVREQCAVTLRIEVSAEQVGAGLYKLLARIENDTTVEQAGRMARDEAALHALASTHTILVVHDGEFCSLIDPLDEYRALAATCCNEGTWPVLVGREGETDTMLSSPITLYDYPQIAAESPGEFFDGTEIDEMLVLRILTLTDEEREAAVAVDERVRSLLTRIGSLSEDQMNGLHGMVRDLRPATAGDSR
jgi:hydrogenase maturation protease